jgi:hypothetical protein
MEVRRSLAALVLALASLGTGACLAGPRYNVKNRARVVTAQGPMARGAAWSRPAAGSAPTTGASGTTSELVLDDTPIEHPPEVPPTPPPPPPKSTIPPAITYGALDGDKCEAELRARGVPFTKVESARGVDRPVRLSGPLHGVDFHSGVPKSQRATSPYEIIDCRLALAIDDFAKQLAAHDIVEVVHFSIYRAPPLGADLSKPHSEHQAGLAMDLGAMIKRDGTRLGVLEDWHGGIGQVTCGKGAWPNPATKNAKELRAILCDAADAQMFHLMLTPNFNAPHKNHFHLEVKRNVKWFIVH